MFISIFNDKMPIRYIKDLANFSLVLNKPSSVLPDNYFFAKVGKFWPNLVALSPSQMYSDSNESPGFIGYWIKTWTIGWTHFESNADRTISHLFRFVSFCCFRRCVALLWHLLKFAQNRIVKPFNLRRRRRFRNSNKADCQCIVTASMYLLYVNLCELSGFECCMVFLTKNFTKSMWAY